MRHTQNTRESHRDQQIAYDYDKQEWVYGADAVPLLRGQLEQELELLNSEGGKWYFVNIRTKDMGSFEEYREMVLEELRALDIEDEPDPCEDCEHLKDNLSAMEPHCLTCPEFIRVTEREHEAMMRGEL